VEKDCAFCEIDADRVIDLELTSVFAIRDGFPVTDGHTLVIPKRHITTWFDATPAERMELWSALEIVCADLDSLYKPDGYNFGINSGESAGQTIPHLHMHVIPRYKGDMDDPRGGVRHVIPHKGNYKKSVNRAEYSSVQEDGGTSHALNNLKPAAHLLTSGPHKPLLPSLKSDIGVGKHLDIAVAFVFRSGLASLLTHVEELLERGGRFRLLTGDYLNATDPDALQQLIDLRIAYPDTCEVYIYSAAKRSFHPKSYLIVNSYGEHIAYVGSSTTAT